MPPKKLSQAPQQQNQQNQRQSGSNIQGSVPPPARNESAIPEHEVKKSSALNAQFALEATKKAYELRQAAYGAGDPNAREEILAKAINKEIEAESFGKAAKYTRSGAFQGLAAGAGLGVQPGVTVGKLTGALVGGLLSSLGAVLGGGVGAAYGAMNGPFWDLGQIASQGVRSIVGDFPNWEATSSQKKALEKMVLGAQRTQKPSQEELEQMRDDDGGATEEDYRQFHNDLTSWIPSMSSMPSLPSMPSMPSMSSIPGLGGRFKGGNPASPGGKTANARRTNQSQQASGSPKPRAPSTNARKNGQLLATGKSQTPSIPGKTLDADNKTVKESATQGTPPKQQYSIGKAATHQSQVTAKSQTSSRPDGISPKVKNQPTGLQTSPKSDEVATKTRPRKLEPRTASNTSQSDQPAAKRKPPKLQPRPKSTAKASPTASS